MRKPAPAASGIGVDLGAVAMAVVVAACQAGAVDPLTAGEVALASGVKTGAGAGRFQKCNAGNTTIKAAAPHSTPVRTAEWKSSRSELDATANLREGIIISLGRHASASVGPALENGQSSRRELRGLLAPEIDLQRQVRALAAERYVIVIVIVIVVGRYCR